MRGIYGSGSTDREAIACRAMTGQEVISFDEVLAIEKKNTARIIPNALEISVERDEKEVKVCPPILLAAHTTLLRAAHIRGCMRSCTLIRAFSSPACMVVALYAHGEEAVFLWYIFEPPRSLQSAAEPLGA